MKRIMLVLLMSFGAMGAQAQLEQAVKKIFAGDTIASKHTALKRDLDSAYVANLQKTLEEARLNEANMRMEMEQMEASDGCRRFSEICSTTPTYRLSAPVHQRNTRSGGR